MSNLCEIREIKKYVDYFYNTTKSDFDENVNPVIIKSALIYQYLLLKYTGKKDSVKNIINSYNGEIGLIGPGNGNITCCLEVLFSRYTFCHLAHFMTRMVDFTQDMVMVVVIAIYFTTCQNFAKKIHCLEISLVCYFHFVNS